MCKFGGSPAIWEGYREEKLSFVHSKSIICFVYNAKQSNSPNLPKPLFAISTDGIGEFGELLCVMNKIKRDIFLPCRKVGFIPHIFAMLLRRLMIFLTQTMNTFQNLPYSLSAQH